MPEFVLDHGTAEASKRFRALDSFTQGYLVCAFFTCTGDGDDAANLLEEADLAELHDSAWDRATADCKAFQEANAAMLEQVYEVSDTYDAERAGSDFWYTRNHHGVGYWCREELSRTAQLDLTNAANAYREVYLTRGDDGKIYIEG